MSNSLDTSSRAPAPANKEVAARPVPPLLPTVAQARKEVPLYSGLLRYFPNALAEVAVVSYIGNSVHNPGQPLHWSRGKSADHEDCLMRHLLEAGTIDTDGMRHSAKVAWRALAMLQLEIEHDNHNTRGESAREVDKTV